MWPIGSKWELEWREGEEGVRYTYFYKEPLVPAGKLRLPVQSPRSQVLPWHRPTANQANLSLRANPRTIPKLSTRHRNANADHCQDFLTKAMCSHWDKAMRINGQDEYKPGPKKQRSEYAEGCVWFQISINVKIQMYCVRLITLKWRCLLPGYRQKHLNCILPSEKIMAVWHSNLVFQFILTYWDRKSVV